MLKFLRFVSMLLIISVIPTAGFAVVCESDQYVKDGECMACPDGATCDGTNATCPVIDGTNGVRYPLNDAGTKCGCDDDEYWDKTSDWSVNICYPCIEIQTTQIMSPDDQQFTVYFGAVGNFFIDLGDGDPVHEYRNTALPSNVIGAARTANFKQLGGPYTVKFCGKATQYSDTAPAVSFRFNHNIVSATGSIGKIFPTLTPRGSLNGYFRTSTQPNFHNLFMNCNQLVNIDKNFFDGIYGYVLPSRNGGLKMFGVTFDKTCSEQDEQQGLCKRFRGYIDENNNSYVPYEWFQDLNGVGDGTVPGFGSSLTMGHDNNIGTTCPLGTFPVEKPVDWGDAAFCRTAAGNECVAGQTNDCTLEHGAGVYNCVDGLWSTTCTAQSCDDGYDIESNCENLINYTITYNLGDGTNNAANPSTYTINTDTIILGAPTRDGFVFGGWYENADFTGDPVTEIPTGTTGNKTFWAKWDNYIDPQLNADAENAVSDEWPFNFTADVLLDNIDFKFKLCAVGDVWVNWGDGSSPEKLQAYKSSNGGFCTDSATLSHRYTNKGKYIVKLRSDNITGYVHRASGVGMAVDNFRTIQLYDNTAIIRVNENGNWIDKTVDSVYIIGLYGSLGKLFPQVSPHISPDTGSRCDSSGPWFSQSFKDLPHLTTISDTLFTDIYADKCSIHYPQMRFNQTFANDTALTGYVPYEMFAYVYAIDNVPDTEKFSNTFDNTALTSPCPDNRESVTGNELVGLGDVNVCKFKNGCVDWMWNNSGNCAVCPENATCNGATFTCFVGYVSNGTECVQETYTVTLNTPNGSQTIDVTYGANMPALSVPTRDGYTFTGYFDAATGGTQYYDANGASVHSWDKTSNASLYAQWTPVTYSITFNTNGGTLVTSPTQYNISSTTVTLPTPTRDGFVFGGWYETEELTGSAVTDIASGSTGNKTFWAQWIFEPTIQIEQAPTESGAKQVSAVLDTSAIQTLAASQPTQEITVATPTVASDEEFNGWYDNPTLTRNAINPFTVRSASALASVPILYGAIVPKGSEPETPGEPCAGYLDNENVCRACPDNATCNDGQVTCIVGEWNGTECTEFPFSLTTTSLAKGAEFKFKISASGDFKVDCGDGGTLSGTGVSGNTITKNNTNNNTYTCKYSNAGAHTIKFGGQATGYLTGGAYGIKTAAISFANVTGTDASGENIVDERTDIYSVSGSLGAVFSTLENDVQPVFYETFRNCTSLTNISDDLLIGISGQPANYMFARMFMECNNLATNITNFGKFFPISGHYTPELFLQTFADCKKLSGSIPSGFFGTLSGAAKASMFSNTFENCKMLTGEIPAGLFGTPTSTAINMFAYTFQGCIGLTGNTKEGTATYAMPSNLFGGDNLTGNDAIYQANMFAGTFDGCTQLEGAIPEKLFGELRGTPASNMFDSTFNKCKEIYGAIPAKLFGTITSNSNVAYAMFDSTFYGCTNLGNNTADKYVPYELFEGIEGLGQSDNITVNGWQVFNNIFKKANALSDGKCPVNRVSVIKPAKTWGDAAFCKLCNATTEYIYNDQCIQCPTGATCDGVNVTCPENNTVDYVTNQCVQNTITYTIAYDKNSDTATGDMASTTCTYDAPCTLSTNAFTHIKSGYVFGGWNTASDGNGTTYADGATVTNLANQNGATVTLYAQWTRVTCDNETQEWTENGCVCKDGFDQTSCDTAQGWHIAGTCTLGNVKKYKCEENICDGYVASCGTGQRATDDTCMSGGNTLTKCAACANASNVATWGDGECQIATCAPDNHKDTATNTCVSDYKPCAVDGLTGTQTWNPNANDGAGDWGECDTGTCPNGQHKVDGACTDCTNEGKDYADTWVLNTCQITECKSGYKKIGDGDNTSCISTTCTDENTVWDDTQNICVCDTGYHEESGSCMFNTKDCESYELPQYAKKGTKTWDPNANDGAGDWGECTVTGCDEGWSPNNANTACERCSNDGVGVLYYQQNTCNITQCDDGYLLGNNNCTECNKSDATGELSMMGGQCVLTCEDGYVPWPM